MLLVRPRGWHLAGAPRRGRRAAGLREPLRLRRLSPPQRRAAARARLGAVLLPPEAREPPRGAALERRLLLRPGSPRDPARDDQGDRPHRDDPRGVRDGGDPVRAARALGRAQRRPLGLHLLGDQEVPRPSRVRAPRPRAGDDDRAVHARVHGAARPHVPPPRRARDRRYGRVHPEPARRRGERDRARPRARGQASASRGTGSTGPGSRIPDLVPVAKDEFDAVLGERPNQLERLREDVSTSRRRTCSTSPRPRARSPRPACGRTSRSGSATSPPGSPGSARRRSTT